jgi:hypothetical protein
MIKIKNSPAPDALKKVGFYRTLFTGRKIEQYVEALISPFDDEGPSVNVPGVNLLIEDIPEFIKAVELAAMIASGELEIE